MLQGAYYLMITRGIDLASNEAVQIITRAINTRTHGRIKRLGVEVQNHKPNGQRPVLLVRGFSDTYHVKQLAQAGVFDACGNIDDCPYELKNEIEVK